MNDQAVNLLKKEIYRYAVIFNNQITDLKRQKLKAYALELEIAEQAFFDIFNETYSKIDFNHTTALHKANIETFRQKLENLLLNKVISGIELTNFFDDIFLLPFDVEEGRSITRNNFEKLGYFGVPEPYGQGDEQYLSSTTWYHPVCLTFKNGISKLFDDDCLSKGEIKRAIEGATAIGLSSFHACKFLQESILEKNYKPEVTIDSSDLYEQLVLTDWYNETVYNERLLDNILTVDDKKLSYIETKENREIQELGGIENNKDLPIHENKGGLKYAILILLLASILGLGVYIFWYKPYQFEKELPRVYSYADNLFLRSSPTSAGNFNILEKLSFGSELIVLENVNGWNKVKYGKKSGYISSDYVLNESNFVQLNCIFYDNTSREAVESSIARRALLDYFQTRGYLGKMTYEMEVELFDYKQNKEIWQLQTKIKQAKTNTVYFKKLFDSGNKFPEFGCIISNINSYQRKFLLFSFDDMGKSTLIYEVLAPSEGYIKDVKRKNRGGRNTYEVVYTDY